MILMEATSLSSMVLLSSEFATHRGPKSPVWGSKSVRHGTNPPQQRVWGLRTTVRARKLCKTRCEKRDEVQLSEPCSTSSLAADDHDNLLTTEAAMASCSITRAFSTMVFMLRSLQSYALHMRQLLSTNSAQEHHDFQCLLAAAVQTDTHCSLVWLFQQVFATTPKLMLSTMIILANFVTISIANSLEQQLSSSSSSSSEDASASSSAARVELEHLPKIQKKNIIDSSAPDVYISGQFASDISSNMIPQESEDQEHSSLMISMLKQAAEDLKLENGRAPHSVEVVPAALVAPVTAEIEPDNYECYDRTELVYQDALGMDKNNPLLLANYAEFLLLVRRDYERAQNLFHLALRADPDDADIICRYAKFLWLVRGDKRTAEEAYRAAMAAEPSHPFYAGCYAHFLWHSGEDQAAAARLSRIQRSDHP